MTELYETKVNLNILSKNSDVENSAYVSKFVSDYEPIVPKFSDYWKNFFQLVWQNKFRSLEFLFEAIMFATIDIMRFIFYLFKLLLTCLFAAIMLNFLIFSLTGIYDPRNVVAFWMLAIFGMIAIAIVSFSFFSRIIGPKFESSLDSLVNPWVTYWHRNDAGEIVPVNFVFDEYQVREQWTSLLDLIFDERWDSCFDDENYTKNVAILNEIRQSVKYKTDKLLHRNISQPVPKKARRHY